MLCVYRIGLWERDGAVSGWAEQVLGGRGIKLERGAHAGAFSGLKLDLLAVAPDSADWAGAEAVSCRMALLPGQAGVLARRLHAPCAVSYGASSRDSLTLSSLEGARLYLSIQRELVTLEGQIVDRQELPLPLPPGQSPQMILARAGLLLLAGISPGEIDGIFRVCGENARAAAQRGSAIPGRAARRQTAEGATAGRDSQARGGMGRADSHRPQWGRPYSASAPGP